MGEWQHRDPLLLISALDEGGELQTTAALAPAKETVVLIE
jgi:hypothetical protein